MASKSKVKTKVKKELSAAQKLEIEKRSFAKTVRGVFDRIGFTKISAISDVEFEFRGRRGDFDDAFVYENVIVFVEYTVSNPTQVGDHIKGKAHLFNKITSSTNEFLKLIFERFPSLKSALNPSYHETQLLVRILYCSKSEINKSHQELAIGTRFWWQASTRYFSDLSSAIKRSARFEFFHFLKVQHADVGVGGVVPQSASNTSFRGSVLPEAHSNFPRGFKVISFYASPGEILSRAYVLRKDGWRDSDGLYQRMISRRKIESIRKHIQLNERVFVNNVILTLPDETKLLGQDNIDVDPNGINKTEPITVQLPNTGNTVGIVDGQHRIFSYYEDTKDDGKIATYRSRQNLLATGIMYPSSYSNSQREQFEASLFLEINSTQNAAGSSLKQAIALIVSPYSADSVAKRVSQKLAELSALNGMLERSFYDVAVLRTTTIVSYGLRPLVRTDGEESIYGYWPAVDEKDHIKQQDDIDSVVRYTEFAAREINKFLSAARAIIGSDRWKLKDKDNAGLITVTFVNGLLVLFRLYIKNRGLSEFEDYKKELGSLSGFAFEAYKSSRYFAMGSAMYAAAFDEKP